MLNELPNSNDASPLSSIKLPPPPSMLELPIKLPVRFSSIVSSPAAFLTTRPTPSPLSPSALPRACVLGFVSGTPSSGTVLQRALARIAPSLAGELRRVEEDEVEADWMRALARDMSKLSSMVTSAAVLVAALRKEASWLKRSSCVPVVSRTRLRSERRALGLEDEASIDGRMRGMLAEGAAGAGESGVEAFFVSPCETSRPRPGEEELRTTGRRRGESRLYGLDEAESVEPTLDGELMGELGLRKSEETVEAASPATCFEGDERMLLLPHALRGDFVGDSGAGILIESNMAASAAFSGDIGLTSVRVRLLRAGDCSIVLIDDAASSGLTSSMVDSALRKGDTGASHEPTGAAVVVCAGNSTSDSFGLSGSGTSAASTAVIK